MTPYAEEPHLARQRLPERELDAAIAALIDHYNSHRYHERIANLTPADVKFVLCETNLAEGGASS